MNALSGFAHCLIHRPRDNHKPPTMKLYTLASLAAVGLAVSIQWQSTAAHGQVEPESGGPSVPELFMASWPALFKLCNFQDPTLCLSDLDDEYSATPVTALAHRQYGEQAYPESTWFTYDTATSSFRLWRKPGLCITFGVTTQLAPCDGSDGQKLLYDESTKMISSPTGTPPGGYCLDISTTPSAWRMMCASPSSSNYEQQRFTVTEIATQNPLVTPPPLMQMSDQNMVFYGLQKMLFRSMAKTDLCLTLDPTWDDATKLRYEPCDGTLDTQTFTHEGWQLKHKATGNCVNQYGGGYTIGACSTSTAVRFDGTNGLLLFGFGTGRQCLDDQGGWGPDVDTETAMALATCDKTSPNQRFHVHLVQELFGPPLLRNPSVFQICTDSSRDHCLGDTGVDVAVSEDDNGALEQLPSATEPEYALRLTTKRFKPYQEATLFTYDRDKHQLRNVGKCDLCVTRNAMTLEVPTEPKRKCDLSIEGSESGVWVLTKCDDDSMAQKFVYNEITKVLSPYDARNMCMSGTSAWSEDVKTVETVECRGAPNDYERVVLVEKSDAPAVGSCTVTTKCPTPAMQPPVPL